MRQEMKIESIVADVNAKEDDNIKHKLNRSRDNDKKSKIIMYVLIGLFVVLLAVIIIYIFIDRKDDNNNRDDNNTDIVNDDVDDTIYSDEIENNIGYVSCDDNTSLLNVRNSSVGNITDGLSCYKMVTILDEIDGEDEVCDKWYEVSYDKNGNDYTGYVCGKYIKMLEVEQSVVNNVKSLIDKANLYYDNSVLGAYCGDTSDTMIIEFDNNMSGEYVKSQYKNIDELENYLLSFMDEDLITTKIELSDIDNPIYYDNYYEIDGSLYCRNYAGKGWNSSYTGNYDIEITLYSDDLINVNIAYEYLKEDSLCTLDELSSCGNSDFVYEIGNISISNNIITKMDFHK